MNRKKCKNFGIMTRLIKPDTAMPDGDSLTIEPWLIYVKND